MENRNSFGVRPTVCSEVDKDFVLDDVTLNNAVKVILLSEPLLFDSIVYVNTTNQVVTLSGYVESMIEKDLVDKVAVELGKFVDVINEVEIMPKLWEVSVKTSNTVSKVN